MRFNVTGLIAAAAFFLLFALALSGQSIWVMVAEGVAAVVILLSLVPPFLSRVRRRRP